MEHSLTAYKVFYEVAKAGNLSRAAKVLAISQPAISKALSKLETELSAKLFYRSSRGVKLTAEGEILFAHVRDGFDHFERGEAELRRLSEFQLGHLRIGVSTTLCKFLLIPYLKEYLKKYPHIKITIENEATAKTLRKIENHELDVGAIVLAEPAKQVNFLRIMEVEDIFVCTPGYLKNLKAVEGEELDVFESANLMLLDQDNITRIHVDEYFKEQGIKPRQVLEISTMDLLIEFAKIGLGVSGVIREFVLPELRDGTLVEIPLKVPVRKRVAGFVYQESNPNEALESFLQSAR